MLNIVKYFESWKDPCLMEAHGRCQLFLQQPSPDVCLPMQNLAPILHGKLRICKTLLHSYTELYETCFSSIFKSNKSSRHSNFNSTHPASLDFATWNLTSSGGPVSWLRWRCTGASSWFGPETPSRKCGNGFVNHTTGYLGCWLPHVSWQRPNGKRSPTVPESIHWFIGGFQALPDQLSVRNPTFGSPFESTPGCAVELAIACKSPVVSSDYCKNMSKSYEKIEKNIWKSYGSPK